MTAIALVAAVGLASCGTAPPAAGHRSHPSPTVSERPSPFNSPVASPGNQSLSCQLPIYGSSVVVSSSGTQEAGGLLALPSGAVTAESLTSLTPVSGQFDEWQSQTTPALFGDSSVESYDSVLGRWVPATPAEIAPTGTQYAYVVVGDITQPQTTPVYVHLVTIATASDEVIYSSGQTEVLGWDQGQLLLVDHLPTSSVTTGLKTIDPASEQINTLEPDTSGVEWYLASPGAVWGGELNSSDPTPPQVQVPQDEALRYDLATGRVAVWSYHPGDQVTVVGTTASGAPLELIQSAAQADLEVATSSTTSSTLLSGPGLASGQGLAIYSTYTDSHGTWIGTDQGLYLLTAALQLIPEQAGNFANATIVGACG
ncbi:MAG: hypothetical protein ACYDC5_01120 [Candidatus Dormibacteria bacterium]